jgi:uncharacterized protein
VIVYVDSSALVKRYILEAGADEVNALIRSAAVVGTLAISRVEVAAALGKAVRVGSLSTSESRKALQRFHAEWTDLVRLQVVEAIVNQAERHAREHGLRAYDAMHLAAATFWQESVGEVVTLATFDRQLWLAARTVGLTVWPAAL